MDMAFKYNPKNPVEFFEDVVPKTLDDKYLKNSRLVSNRIQQLKYMPKNAVCVEIGTYMGGFAKLIYQIMEPKKLHIIDCDFSSFDHSYFNDLVTNNLVELHHGNSVDIMSQFPEHYFGFIYIDGDHSYKGVKNDFAQAKLKVKQNGWIVCNDYTIFSPCSLSKMGIPRAVHEFCIESDWEIIYFSLHPRGFYDVALRKIINE